MLTTHEQKADISLLNENCHVLNSVSRIEPIFKQSTEIERKSSSFEEAPSDKKKHSPKTFPEQTLGIYLSTWLLDKGNT